MVQSKFSIKGIITVSTIVSLGIVTYLVSKRLLYTENINKLIFSILLVFFLIVTLYLIISDVRLKMCKIKIENQFMRVTNFIGLGKTKKYSNSEILGYTISNIPGTLNSKWIYIYSLEKKRIARISDFYFYNYSDLWKVIKTNYTDLGYERFSFLAELKDSFS